MHEAYDVLVVGGGASGMLAAGRAAALGKKVLLVEKNKRLGEKLRISGGGRCNITNAELDTRALLKHFGKAESALYSAFVQFGVEDTFAFFESLGLPLKVEVNKRAFPTTQKAPDVVHALERYIKAGGVEVRTSSPVSAVQSNTSGITSVRCGTKTYTAKQYIFATGSVSHPETGSTGDGFGWLRKLGHTVHAPTPTIVPLKVSDAWAKSLAGTSLSGMKLTFFVSGSTGLAKKSFAKSGKLLFTHFGISGPLVLNAAGAVADLLHEGSVMAEIDCYPTLDLGALEKKIIAAFDAQKNKTLKNSLKELLPAGMPKGVLLALGNTIDSAKKVHSVTKEERKVLVRLLKALPLTIEGLMGLERAVVADGGVPLSEIDTRSMQSKKMPNLFVIGDLLHINRPSGGYSLQLCWTTGYVAGTHAASGLAK